MRLKAKWATRLKNVVTGLRFYATRNPLKGLHGQRCLDIMTDIGTSVSDEGVLLDGDAQVLGTASGDEKSTSDEPRRYDPLQFRPPTYTSDNCPQLPHELIEHICEFHRDYPLVLVNCMRVCSAWYHATRRLLGISVALELRTRAGLHSYARRLSSTRKTAYGEQFYHIIIRDNPRERFARVWPTFIPASFLPKVEKLELHNIDWTTTSPYHDFYQRLSSYSSITKLHIAHCSFRTGRELRRIISTLHNLKWLELTSITLQTPPAVLEPVPFHSSARHQKLKEIRLHGSCEYEPRPGEGMLDTCTVYSSIHTLEMGRSLFPPVSRLPQYLDCFPQLRHFSVTRALELDLGNGPVGPKPKPPTEYTLACPLFRTLKLELSDWWMTKSETLQLLRLLSTSYPCSTLENLAVTLRFKPPAEIYQCLTHLLRSCGPALHDFKWNGEGDVIPQLIANSSLQKVDMKLWWATGPRLVRAIRKILDSVLSNITSTQLQWLNIEFHIDLTGLSHATIEKSFEGVYSAPEFISAFQSILSRSVFNGLPAYDPYKEFGASVYIYVDFYYSKDKPETAALISAYMSAIKLYVLTLFKPWWDRRVWGLYMWSPDGEYYESFFCRRTSIAEETTQCDDALVSQDEPPEDNSWEGGSEPALGDDIRQEWSEALDEQEGTGVSHDAVSVPRRRYTI